MSMFTMKDLRLIIVDTEASIEQKLLALSVAYPIGRGATEDDAIDDLLNQLED